MEHGKAYSRFRSAFDTVIAAVAEANDCVVVADRDFTDVEVVNPLRSARR